MLRCALQGPELVFSLFKMTGIVVFLCHQVFSTNTRRSVTSEIQVREKEEKKSERWSERTPVSADLIRYHNLTKQSLLIYTNTPRQFLQIPPTLPNATVKKYPNPQTREDYYYFNYALFCFISPS